MTGAVEAGSLLDAMLHWARVDSTSELWLVGFGLAAQSTFFGRWLVQWFVSERRGESHIPLAFWIMSLVGASMLLIYFLMRGEPVGALGQSVGWFVYSRNLQMILRDRRGAVSLQTARPG